MTRNLKRKEAPDTGESSTKRRKPDEPAEITAVVSITLGPDEMISSLEVGGRTPSPYSRRMGDHLTSWQALVDAVHARLYGLAIPAAAAALRALHDAHPVPEELLLLLEDRATRRALLDAESTQVAAGLERVRNETDARTALEGAVAHHLAYRNYLPFATVPAASDVGSTGGPEGAARRRLLAHERAHPLPEVPPPSPPPAETGDTAAEAVPPPVDDALLPEVPSPSPPPAETGGTAAEAVPPPVDDALRQRLWVLFDDTAALREAHVRYLADDSKVAAATGAAADVAGIADHLTGLGEEHVLEVLPDLYGRAEKAASKAKADKVDDDIVRAAQDMQGAIGKVKDMKGEYKRDRESRKAALRRLLEQEAPGYADAAKAAVKREEAVAAAAPGRAVEVLSHLLVEHARVVAAAYPASVRDSGFLGRIPADLRARILHAHPHPSVDGQRRLQALIDGVQARLAVHLDKLVIAASNSWVTAGVRDTLVVSYSPGTTEAFRIQGRPRAPRGVKGMGSHVTAWVLHEGVLQQLAPADATSAAVIAALQHHVREALGSPVMTQLDWLLPADQLNGGQLEDLFTAAAAVLAITPPPGAPGEVGPAQINAVNAAAMAYLRFQNLLPYATVDAGDRGGKGEHAAASADKLLDDKALKWAAELQAEAINRALNEPDPGERDPEDYRQGGLRAALLDAAEALEELPHTGPGWADLASHVTASVARLRATEGRLAEIATTNIADLIQKVRLEEHDRIVSSARPSG